jgi:rhodanese-related sulfurtransferase
VVPSLKSETRKEEGRCRLKSDAKTQQLVAEGAQLVEVLPKEEFDEQHLPGAIHIPLRKIDPGVRASLAPERPVVVYCWDSA